MITRSRHAVQIIDAETEINKPSVSWQTQLKDAIRTPEALCNFLGLDNSVWQTEAQEGHALFPIRVPLAYARRIQAGNPDDPLLRQVLPIARETDSIQGFISDPLEEAEHTPRPGLIHKYHNRVLLIASGGCAVNCRYCFRRHFPYQENIPSRSEWHNTLEYVHQHPEITEVILSGGDPLLSTDDRLAELITQIEQIPHVIRLRVHTRLPVVIPDRVTEALCQRLSSSRLQRVVVLHINHPSEIDEDVISAVQRLSSAGVTVLNQSVLLRDINDSVAVLATLSERLFAAGIMPYYLHVLDPVAGAAHFDVPDREAVELVDELRTHLAGFLVPKLVREIPGRLSKTPLY
ncbi:EF-P beta-lysylation protein EpmB [Zymobacter sp. IVIA_12111.31 C1]|uniref:EF-P beta-lysylation protein EpmB n=1 Tax=Zymobacter sp. IVIA_12111.31 C1 TaxID=3394854 RepID=UPI0039C12361